GRTAAMSRSIPPRRPVMPTTWLLVAQTSASARPMPEVAPMMMIFLLPITAPAVPLLSPQPAAKGRNNSLIPGYFPALVIQEYFVYLHKGLLISFRFAPHPSLQIIEKRY